MSACDAGQEKIQVGPRVARLPFRVVRDSRVGLTDRIVDGISRAVRSGRYAPGDRIRTIVEMARAFGGYREGMAWRFRGHSRTAPT